MESASAYRPLDANHLTDSGVGLRRGEQNNARRVPDTSMSAPIMPMRPSDDCLAALLAPSHSQGPRLAVEEEKSLCRTRFPSSSSSSSYCTPIAKDMRKYRLKSDTFPKDVLVVNLNFDESQGDVHSLQITSNMNRLFKGISQNKRVLSLRQRQPRVNKNALFVCRCLLTLEVSRYSARALHVRQAVVHTLGHGEGHRHQAQTAKAQIRLQLKLQVLKLSQVLLRNSILIQVLQVTAINTVLLTGASGGDGERAGSSLTVCGGPPPPAAERSSSRAGSGDEDGACRGKGGDDGGCVEGGGGVDVEEGCVGANGGKGCVVCEEEAVEATVVGTSGSGGSSTLAGGVALPDLGTKGLSTCGRSAPGPYRGKMPDSSGVSCGARSLATSSSRSLGGAVRRVADKTICCRSVAFFWKLFWVAAALGLLVVLVGAVLALVIEGTPVCSGLGAVVAATKGFPLWVAFLGLARAPEALGGADFPDRRLAGGGGGDLVVLVVVKADSHGKMAGVLQKIDFTNGTQNMIAKMSSCKVGTGVSLHAGIPEPPRSAVWPQSYSVSHCSVCAAERCQVILTSGYGYRQFIPLEAALATPGDTDPMDGYPAPAAPGPAPTPPPHLRPGNTTPAMRGNATGPGGSPPASGSSPPPLPERLVLRFHVVLGAGNNTYTDFRRLPASLPPRRAFNYSAGVVSGAELRAFWLLVDLRTGVLAVGPAGGAPILAWVDPEPLRVRYLSLCTWTDVEGMWLYGCENRGEYNCETYHSKGQPEGGLAFGRVLSCGRARRAHLLTSLLHPGHPAGDTSPTGALDAEWMGPAERLRQHVLVPHKKSPPHHAVDVRVRLDVDRFAVWRACPSGTPTEQVLEMLDAMDAEEARRDWHMLAVVLERVASVIYLILVLAAMVPSLMRAS
ncbi:hypothetical protein FOCC_FOCC001750 [Frankliniella occidentalis]|nr:hypothetical protein FOCC_FOCC001750 [Frankliniella occidentalis]